MKYFGYFLARVTSGLLEAILKFWFAVAGDPPVWLTDYEAALTQAAAEKKIVLAVFTGSDWCGPCQLQSTQVFATLYFDYWAKKRAVLLELDFPEHHTLPAPLVQQNDALKKKYGVEAFPTTLGLDPDGTERGRVVGYPTNTGPITWVADFETATKLSQVPV